MVGLEWYPCCWLKPEIARRCKRKRKNSWWRRVAGKSTKQRGMEEAPENSKELSHSAYDNGLNE